jgi:hypothetical protein
MNIRLHIILWGVLLSFCAHSNDFVQVTPSQDHPWSLIASFGPGKYPYSFNKDKSTAVGRFALGNELLLAGSYALGLELGLQNGAHLKLDIPKTTLALMSWLPARTTLAPMPDFLMTAKSDSIGSSLLFAELKGGVAYRHWAIHHDSVQVISKIACEIQAGLGYPITTLANLSLLYQGVFGGNPKLQFSPNNTMEHVSNIPPLHAVLLGLSVNL